MTGTGETAEGGEKGGGPGCLLRVLLGVAVLVLLFLLFQDRIMALVLEDYFETNVTSRLRGIARGQERFRADRAMDADGDGKGEYGTLAELMGHPIPGRTLEARGSDRGAYYGLSGGVLHPGGAWSGHEEWCYVLYLPAAGGVSGAVREVGPAPALQPGDAVSADGAEARWWAYGWPKARGAAGRRAFYADSTGRLLASPNRKAGYDGVARIPPPGAAFPPGAPPDGSVPPVPGAPAQDGEAWEPLPR